MKIQSVANVILPAIAFVALGGVHTLLIGCSDQEDIRGYGTDLLVDYMKYRCKNGVWPEAGSISFSPYYEYKDSMILPDGSRLDQFIAQNGEVWNFKLDKEEIDLKFYVGS